MKLSIDCQASDRPPPRDWAPDSNSWDVTLTLRHGKLRRTIRTDFYTGSALGEPTAEDVVSALALDAVCGEYDYYEFCDELGYTPSREAEATWKACRASGRRWERFVRNLPDEAAEELQRIVVEH